MDSEESEAFREWKQNEVTQKVMLNLRNRVVQLQDRLGQEAGIDPRNDRYLSGYITACMDFLNVENEE